MILGDVIDPLDHLCVLNPAMRVEDKVEHALFDDSCVDGGFPIVDGNWVVVAVQVLRFPVTGHHAGHFPDAAAEVLGGLDGDVAVGGQDELEFAALAVGAD